MASHRRPTPDGAAVRRCGFCRRRERAVIPLRPGGPGEQRQRDDQHEQHRPARGAGEVDRTEQGRSRHAGRARDRCAPAEPSRGVRAVEQHRRHEHERGTTETGQEPPEHGEGRVRGEGEQGHPGGEDGGARSQDGVRPAPQHARPDGADHEQADAEGGGEPAEPRLVDADVAGGEHDAAAEGGDGEPDRGLGDVHLSGRADPILGERGRGRRRRRLPDPLSAHHPPCNFLGHRV